MEDYHIKIKKEADSLTPIEENDHQAPILPISDQESKTSNDGHNTSFSSTEIDLVRDNDELLLLDNLIKREETLLSLSKNKNIIVVDSAVKKTPSFVKQTTSTGIKEAAKNGTIHEEPSREASAIEHNKEAPQKEKTHSFLTKDEVSKENKEYEEFKQEILKEIKEEEENKDKLDEELDKKYDYLVTRDESDDDEVKNAIDEEKSDFNLPSFDNKDRVPSSGLNLIMESFAQKRAKIYEVCIHMCA
jgi:hypothetical protein